MQPALDAGAIAAVIDEPVSASGILLRVDDALGALQQLGHWARKRWGKPIVAVTGSAGKTTTKDVIAELLSARMRVGKTSRQLRITTSDCLFPCCGCQGTRKWECSNWE